MVVHWYDLQAGRGRSYVDRHSGISQYRADRLDPELLLVLVDIVDDQRAGRSSSAAKNADADFKIAFAFRNSRFSNSANRTAVSAVIPGRSPASISARLIQPSAFPG